MALCWGVCTTWLPATVPERIRQGYLPGGPYGVLAALAHEYYAIVPPLWTVRAGPFELTDRLIVGIPILLVCLV